MEVRLIAITEYLDPGRPEQLYGSPEQLIEHAGHVCYAATNRDGEDTAGFVQKRIRQGHESLIEHASATFEISGISRACSHQLVRHRLASYSQESQRYVQQGVHRQVIPDSVRDDGPALLAFDLAMERAFRSYYELLDLGIPKEDARFVLPNAAITCIVMTMNFRSLRHFIKLRTDPAAQWEVNSLAQEILRQLLEVAPNVFGDL